MPQAHAVPQFIETREKKKLLSVRDAHLKRDYPTLENQPESLINEAISLTSMDDICQIDKDWRAKQPLPALLKRRAFAK